MSARERLEEVLRRFDGSQTDADVEELKTAWDVWVNSDEFTRDHAEWLAKNPR